MARLRAGVIGVGQLGQHHARLYASLPSATLAGVVDASPQRARLIGDRHGVPFYTDLQALLGHVDLVSVAAPTSTHYALVKSCLQAGKHVLVEKPIAVTPAEGRELAQLAARQSCVLQVGHSERFNPIMQLMRPLIRHPAFIECHRLSTFSERGTDVDVVLDLMIHDLDLVLSLGPGSVEEVRAAGVPVLSSNIDIANARITFSSGCVANLTSSRVSTNKMRRLRVFQHESYLSIDFQTRHGMRCRRVVNPGGQPSIEMEPFQGSDDEPLKLELQAFLSTVTGQSPPVVSAEEGTVALDLAHRVLDAIGVFARRHEAMGRSSEVSIP